MFSLVYFSHHVASAFLCGDGDDGRAEEQSNNSLRTVASCPTSERSAAPEPRLFGLIVLTANGSKVQQMRAFGKLHANVGRQEMVCPQQQNFAAKEKTKTANEVD